jgi:hypothetical protein
MRSGIMFHVVIIIICILLLFVIIGCVFLNWIQHFHGPFAGGKNKTLVRDDPFINSVSFPMLCEEFSGLHLHNP